MLDKLIEVFENISSRRRFIGRSSAQAIALMAGVFGFTQLAEAGCCGVRTGCCCLCKISDSNCQQTCKDFHGSAHWCWTCAAPLGTMSCYECFFNTGGCGGTCQGCESQNVLCSQAQLAGICPGGNC